jgi:hypothetical protein
VSFCSVSCLYISFDSMSAEDTETKTIQDSSNEETVEYLRECVRLYDEQEKKDGTLLTCNQLRDLCRDSKTNERARSFALTIPDTEENGLFERDWVSGVVSGYEQKKTAIDDAKKRQLVEEALHKVQDEIKEIDRRLKKTKGAKKKKQLRNTRKAFDKRLEDMKKIHGVPTGNPKVDAEEQYKSEQQQLVQFCKGLEAFFTGQDPDASFLNAELTFHLRDELFPLPRGHWIRLPYLVIDGPLMCPGGRGSALMRNQRFTLMRDVYNVPGSIPLLYQDPFGLCPMVSRIGAEGVKSLFAAWRKKYEIETRMDYSALEAAALIAIETTHKETLSRAFEKIKTEKAQAQAALAKTEEEMIQQGAELERMKGRFIPAETEEKEEKNDQ